jgi:hypothetical protein
MWRDDYVDLQAHKIPRELIELIRSSFGRPNLVNNVPTFDISQLAQALLNGLGMLNRQEPDPMRLRCPLRPSRDWCDDE